MKLQYFAYFLANSTFGHSSCPTYSCMKAQNIINRNKLSCIKGLSLRDWIRYVSCR